METSIAPEVTSSDHRELKAAAKAEARRGRDEAKAAREQQKADAKQAKLDAKAEARREREETRELATVARAQERADAVAADVELTQIAEVSAADETALSEDLGRDGVEPGRQHRQDARDARRATAAAKTEAKQQARAERNDARAQAAAARSAARAAQVDTHTAQKHDRELEPVDVAAEEESVESPKPVTEVETVQDAAELELEQDSTEPEPEPDPEPDDEKSIEEGDERERREALDLGGKSAKAQAANAKLAARREHREAKESARLERADAKEAARSEKVAQRANKRPDRIVEPPREPKVSFAERRRQKAAGVQTATGDPDRSSGARRAIAATAAALGAIGLICSVTLAVGALMVAIGAGENNAAYDALSSIADALVGPLRDVFTFTGANADDKEALVAWGLGSMGYLLVGLFAQSFLRSRIED
ncbi:hypothetical protein C6I20_10155 [Aeromicrobium sp. A1-2]|nr:hypothetical protein C6I20_10155 [Aeromicrobium sp. A1-2]